MTSIAGKNTMSIESIMTNRFAIPNPDEWYCKVLNYPFALTNMKVEVRHPDGTVIFLEFRNIVYFSGYFSWKGVNFRVADEQEFLQFIHGTTTTYEQLPADELISPSKLGIFRLYICEGTESTTIRLIANAAWSIDQSGQTLLEVY
jgi:hypothetical protein